MPETLRIVIPTAGLATRMRPQTWSKPKPLVSVAGKTSLEHLLDSFRTLPQVETAEYVIILGPNLGETQIPPFMKEHYPNTTVHYVVQEVMRGQSDAIWLARQYLQGPMLMCFSDTLMETDFSFLADEKADAVAWVKPVPDPRRFGVAEVDGNGRVTRLVEKPDTLENNRVVVGCYYFKDASRLLAAIQEQMKRGTSLRGEYFLTDAINIMIEGGLNMRVQTVEVWLDTGTIEATLETNRYLLEHGCARQAGGKLSDVKVIPPVFIDESAVIERSTIGPYASVGANCTIRDVHLENSILEDGVVLESLALRNSFVGRQAHLQGRSPEDPPWEVNVGDNSSVAGR